MQKLFSVLLMLGCAASVVAQSKMVIKGTVKGDLQGYHKIYVLEDGKKKDSVEIQDGQFSISLPWVKGAAPVLRAAYETKLKPMPPALQLLTEGPGTVYLNVADAARGLRSAKIRGSRAAVTFQEFEAGRHLVSTEMTNALKERFPDKSSADSARGAALQELVQTRMIPYICNFIEAHADDYVGTFILGRYQSILPPADLERIYHKLTPKQKRSDQGKEVAARLQGIKNETPGFEVANFVLNTPEDQSVAFHSFRGKYILIDFWASWCGPCKASFPRMKELYQKYRSDKFEVLSISIDHDKNAWLNELKKQQLPWPQVLDTKKISVNNFAVTAVPTAYLVSPEGKIIMKQIGFGEAGDGEIEKKLKELFGI
ncbi:MAG: AhpC/TSA family protein [Chitinophaga sp.]|uniref:TlpA disulfide reductase family protein n=1 Tax=Chitinophaga sp. TaxID=1869181 RepID=UPI001B24E0E3|nr:TlpA disulfide reductase family protein [Chitinophaga sp.]MBO9732642.1 AhpC/TSA family protein [Chitinophaga sp.]